MRNKELPGKLVKWRGKFENAKSKYDEQLTRFGEAEKLYDGAHEMVGSDGPKKARATQVRNLCYEMVESEVDSSVPRPKVTALHKEDEKLARKIEAFLLNEAARLPMAEINDRTERETYIYGISYMDVCWDALGGMHETLGAADVKSLSARQIIPQPGIDDLYKMDYFFAVQPMSVEAVKKRYGVSLTHSGEDEKEVRQRGGELIEAEDMVSVVSAYYRNENGGVGCYTWCLDEELEDFEDFMSKQQRVCSRCGRVVKGDKCECGSTKWHMEAMETTTIDLPVMTAFGELQPTRMVPKPVMGADGEPMMEAAEDENGIMQPVLDEDGNGIILMQEREEKVEIPVYKIKEWPVIARKNISRGNTFCGVSDVEVIQDQQELVKKLGSKIQEKLLGGGSFVTLPEGVNIDTSNREFKVLRLETPAQKNLIDVLTIQPNISYDIQMMQSFYEIAKSTLGISDSYQGKYDASASSGAAKQAQISQAAARLESKHVMKYAAWARLYRMIFLYWLAFADDPACVSDKSMGVTSYEEMSKWEFLKRDKAGELYWNDEFLFDVDSQALTVADRRALQDEAKQNFASGVFGDPASSSTRVRYWRYMAGLHYPYAEEMLRISVEAQKEEEKKAMAQQQIQAIANGAAEGAAEGYALAGMDISPRAAEIGGMQQ